MYVDYLVYAGKIRNRADTPRFVGGLDLEDGDRGYNVSVVWDPTTDLIFLKMLPFAVDLTLDFVKNYAGKFTAWLPPECLPEVQRLVGELRAVRAATQCKLAWLAVDVSEGRHPRERMIRYASYDSSEAVVSLFVSANELDLSRNQVKVVWMRRDETHAVVHVPTHASYRVARVELGSLEEDR